MLQVDLAAIDDGVEVLAVDRVVGHADLQCLCRRVRGAPGHGGGHLATPPGEFAGGHRAVVHLVDNIIDLTTERVEGRDRRAPCWWQEHERVVERRAAGGGALLHVLLRRHAVRPMAWLVALARMRRARHASSGSSMG